MSGAIETKSSANRELASAKTLAFDFEGRMQYPTPASPAARTM
jgi:hypothetical protein